MRISEVANAVQWINTHKEAVTEADLCQIKPWQILKLISQGS